MHARTLREVLTWDGVFTAAGMAMSTTVSAALCRQISEHAAGALLAQARVLSGLPGGLEAVECGLLGVEQSGAVAKALLPLDADVRVDVWGRLLERLLTDAERCEVLPAARVRSLVAGWLIEADPRAAEERRRAAEAAAGDVDY